MCVYICVCACVCETEGIANVSGRRRSSSKSNRHGEASRRAMPIAPTVARTEKKLHKNLRRNSKPVCRIETREETERPI